MNNYKIGSFIAKKRKEQNLKQKDLAEKLFVTDKTISRWETGNYMPDLTILVTLAEILNTSVYELLIGECSIRDCIIKNVVENVSIIASNVNLSAAEMDLRDEKRKERYEREERNG